MPNITGGLSKYGLVDIVQNDGSLTAGEKATFSSLANLFEQDFKENLRLTSLELDDKLSTKSPSLWQQFLSHNSVKNFIDNYIYEEVEKKAMNAIGEGITDSNKALKAKDAVDKKKKREDNTNIIVMLLPEKDELEDLGL
jgi:hypothetical protein